MKSALTDKSEEGVLTQASKAITATEKSLRPKIEKLLLATVIASGTDIAKELARKFKAAYSPDQARDPNGEFAHGGGARKKNADKVAAAKASHKPATAEKQRHAEGNEKEVAALVGGQGTDDNKPMDVVAKVGSKLHGVEVKTMVDNKNNKITMHPKSKDRKEAWARKNRAELHTVVIDDRQAFRSKDYSGHRLYYRRGVGSFRLKGLTRVKDGAHLRQLMGLK